MTSKLHEHVQKRLAERPRSVTYSDITKATGLSYRFLCRVAAGDTKGYSVEKLETLYRYFEGHELQL